MPERLPANGYPRDRRYIAGGTNWTTIHDPGSGGVTGFISFRDIVIDPDDSRVIYATGGSGEINVIVSTDCGASWSNIDSDGIPVNRVPSLIDLDPVNNFLYVMENNPTGRLYRKSITATGTGACPGGSPADNPPEADDDFVTTGVSEDITFNSGVTLINNDSDPDGDDLTVASGTFATAQGGSIQINSDGSYSYTSAQDFFGEDSYVYTLQANGLTDTATVTITVDPVNDAPVANNDSIEVVSNTVFNSVKDLDENDDDVEGDTLTIVGAGTVLTAQGGSITIAVDGSYTYTPLADFSGNDNIDYTITDGEFEDSGTLNITVISEEEEEEEEDNEARAEALKTTKSVLKSVKKLEKKNSIKKDSKSKKYMKKARKHLEKAIGFLKADNDAKGKSEIKKAVSDLKKVKEVKEVKKVKKEKSSVKKLIKKLNGISL